MSMAKSVRTTISVREELSAALAEAAASCHVSTAWAIRKAPRLYLSKQTNFETAFGAGPRNATLADNWAKRA